MSHIHIKYNTRRRAALSGVASRKSRIARAIIFWQALSLAQRLMWCVGGEGLPLYYVLCVQGKDKRSSFCGGITPLISERAWRTPAWPLIQIMEVNIAAAMELALAAAGAARNWIFDSCRAVKGDGDFIEIKRVTSL